MKSVLFIISFIPIIASAAVWRPMNFDGSPSVHLDVQSIVSQPNQQKKAWVRYTYDSLQETELGKPYQQALVLEIFDCRERSVAAKQEVLYDSPESGKVVQSGVIQRPQFREVVPESLAEANLNFVCDLKIPVRK